VNTVIDDPADEQFIAPARPVIGDAEIDAAVRVLRSGNVAQGPEVAAFEAEFAALVAGRHCVAVNSGTSALLLALIGLRIGPGDEVIVPSFTFAATANAVRLAGATPVFADIDPDTFCLDPDATAAAIGPRTAAIMPVHLYGHPADMARIGGLAARYQLAVVEDAAQAHGARYAGRPAGSFGLGCFSFYATKNITTGEGGAITTNDSGLADRLRVLRNQGMRERYVYEMVGHNYRMSDLHAAIAMPQLDRVDRNIAARQANAQALSEGLAGLPGLSTPTQLEGRTHVWHQYTVQVDEQARIGRDELAAGLGERGIGCGVYYPKLVSDYTCYRDHPRVIAEDTPVAARIARQCLSLPVHTALTEVDVAAIVGAVRELLE
jgi:perosamine synthetase